ncbi:hypothetical protein [Rhodococcus sp. ARC_M6]|uniref:hypothetical protein n=1 Tax=Rhodococcus sp. ARC_M6 TaxID=2928852 RepID=UPI001FB39F83|nr:hypothetical protein [Rhodococcus sp. ARC_M6]MCJ0906211.1 hypothetical protein [Rhodococcus sp. ARC_M6]
MTYADQHAMSQNSDIVARITACAATQTLPPVPMFTRGGPREWATRNAIRVAGQPGWPEAWASAIASDVQQPGLDQGVISDGMILSAVQAVLST